MKILHLNTYENGGAGRASYRLNNALRAAGIDSQLHTYIKLGKNESLSPLYTTIIEKGHAVINILLERYLPKWYVKNVKVPFSLQFFGKDIHHHPAVKAADILHLHWVNHGFLAPKNLEKLATLNKPIVWTMHDCNIFTGGCHVRLGCENYFHECGNCPFLKRSDNDDISYQTLIRKQKAYGKLNLTLVSPSAWLATSAGSSSLLKTLSINVIPNTLETNLFKPVEKSRARKSLGIEDSKFIILTGFMPSANDTHKGTTFLLEALNKWTMNNPEMRSNAMLLIFGNKNKDSLPQLDIPVTFLGTLNDDRDLVNAYSAADMFITTSIDDNLPNTVMESMACGTPVLAFTTGGIPEMVDHKINGYLAEYKNSNDLVEGLQWFYQHPDRNSLGQEARFKVLNSYSEEKIARMHVSLYDSLLNKLKNTLADH